MRRLAEMTGFILWLLAQSTANAQITGKYYDIEYTKTAKQVAEACGSGSDTIVEFTKKSVDFSENSCKINKIESWPQSKTMFDYFVRCTGGNRKARLIIEKTSGERVWIQWDDGSTRSKTSGAIYQKCPTTEAVAERSTSKLPKQVGACVDTTISKITDRFGKALDAGSSGTIVFFANGGHQVSYETENSIARSRLGDRVSMCLKYVPKDCPPGDERGKIYNTRNLRTDEAWTLPDEQHRCGGA